MKIKRSYASGASILPLIGMTIGDKFDEIVGRFSERPAIVSVHQNIRLSYSELAREVNSLAKAFIANGITKGDRIGIWSPNNVEWVICQYASAKIGAILVTINPAYRIHELSYVLKQSECKALVIQNQFKTSDYEAMILELCPNLSLCQAGKLDSPDFAELAFVISTTSSSIPGIFDWQEFKNLGSIVNDELLSAYQGKLDFNEAINIQYTSGTTGFPKGATLSHHNILNNGFFTAETMNLTSEDKLVAPVPLYHCFGMVMANLGCLTHGACVIYPSESFEPLATLLSVE
jgi:fatty-acyl-CoA synthase